MTINYTLGQRVWLEPEGNNKRYNWRKGRIAEIVKIGREYVYVDLDGYQLKFNKETRCENNGMSANWRMWESEKLAQEEADAKLLARDLQTRLQYSALSKFTLEQLKRIDAILKETDS